MSKHYSRQEKNYARNLYRQGVGILDISHKTGIAYRTLSEWARREKWPNQYCDFCNTPFRGKNGFTLKGEDFDLYFCGAECLFSWQEGEGDER